LRVGDKRLGSVGGYTREKKANWCGLSYLDGSQVVALVLNAWKGEEEKTKILCLWADINPNRSKLQHLLNVAGMKAF